MKPTTKQIQSKKLERLHQWEDDFNVTFRRIGTCLMISLPLFMIFSSRYFLINQPDLTINQFQILWASSIAILSGVISIFIPWKHVPPGVFAFNGYATAICLCFIVRASGYHESPFHDFFFMAIILSAFYFIKWTLYGVLTCMTVCFFLSKYPDPFFFLHQHSSLVVLLIFIGMSIIVHYFGQRLKRYQKIACNSYEELIKQKEKIFQIQQMESIIETIGSVSHQLSQPLTVALGELQLLLMDYQNHPPSEAELTKIKDYLLKVKKLLIEFAETSEYATEEYVGGTRILKTSSKKR